MSWNPRVKTLKTQVGRLKAQVVRLKAGVRRIKVSVEAIKLRVEIVNIRVSKRKILVQNIEFHELQKVLFLLLSECWTWASLEGFEKSFPHHGFEKCVCDHYVTIIF